MSRIVSVHRAKIGLPILKDFDRKIGRESY